MTPTEGLKFGVRTQLRRGMANSITGNDTGYAVYPNIGPFAALATAGITSVCAARARSAPMPNQGG